MRILAPFQQFSTIKIKTDIIILIAAHHPDPLPLPSSYHHSISWKRMHYRSITLEDISIIWDVFFLIYLIKIILAHVNANRSRTKQCIRGIYNQREHSSLESCVKVSSEQSWGRSWKIKVIIYDRTPSGPRQTETSATACILPVILIRDAVLEANLIILDIRV